MLGRGARTPPDLSWLFMSQAVRCGRSADGEEEVDRLFRGRESRAVRGGAEWVRHDAGGGSVHGEWVRVGFGSISSAPPNSCITIFKAH